ncbi:MAG: serine hydroxymethyltransferase [Planctomycetia bacterium TMED53]|nr:MAG: serine hydroxymethyltransferase [Planctomycetia bacterium TMED53]
METLESSDPDIAAIVTREEERQRNEINLIASENIVSEAVLTAQGSVLTNKYAEGYPGKRYYGGCEVVDEAENLARDRAKELFGADHANVQPHSGTQANIAAYSALLKPGDKVLAMDLAHGGHLSHGAKVSLTGKVYDFSHYPVNPDSEMIDMDEVMRIAREVQPQLIIAGASAYPRVIDFEAFRNVADEVGAKLMVDMAHIAGLVAAGVHPSPIPHADVVTTTTHKTLRGPRSGLILCRKKWAKKIDSGVFPGDQGGPLMHLVAARAVCFKEAMSEEFREYARNIVSNAQRLGEILQEGGVRLVAGGTENHMVLADVRSLDLTGDIAERALGAAGIVVNMNMIPHDPNPPLRPSGIRIGTPTVTSRGMGAEEITQIGQWIVEVLKNSEDAALHEGIRAKVRDMCVEFPTRI